MAGRGKSGSLTIWLNGTPVGTWEAGRQHTGDLADSILQGILAQAARLAQMPVS